ncbi:uncharacterized protein At5g65660-like [Nicotiana tabacum]|uniref:Uncharacterized protein At5g65660-like n=2 Tax=Nicotiana TaxID=4085 RepID=A0A1S4BZ67_TOBAC|nr:PREDICTED: uncharacterized protein At5g65660-like [Nicotiana sylvestris]XP_016494201.1 PREDICTED: uncharacterized protein At5g65660-like [Nicotiana tabacum]
MERPPYYAPSHINVESSSRPSLGFPLGTAVLLIVIFSLSGVSSCCYHWDKIRSLRRRSFPDLEGGDDPASLKPKQTHMSEKQNQSQILPAVLMPGDQVPKFIALPCPCQPPRTGKVVVEVQTPPRPPPSPPKPIRMVMGLPLY